MQISDKEVSGLLAYAPQGRRADRNATGSTPAATSDAYALRPAADVSLSSAARDIQLAKKAINALPEVREDRVRALKAQVGKRDVSCQRRENRRPDHPPRSCG